MKHIKSISVVAAILSVGAILLCWNDKHNQPGRQIPKEGANRGGVDLSNGAPRAFEARGESAVETASGYLSLEERKLMSDSDRLAWLEGHGEVPQDGDLRDWQLAQRTTWWGKPLDAKRFWSNRVIWRDVESQLRANRHGRAWPPIPSEYSEATSFTNRDEITWSSGSPDGLNIHFASSWDEDAFWSSYDKAHPKPPDDLLSKQNLVATMIYQRRSLTQAKSTPTQALTGIERTIVARATDTWYPEEEFTQHALFWAYVVKQREKYQKLTMDRHLEQSALIRSFLSSLAVDLSYITNQLTPEQLKAANAWKLDYLQRLRREGIDESYINAYLKAWNLSAAEVFGESK